MNYRSYSFVRKWYIIFCLILCLHRPGFTQRLFTNGASCVIFTIENFYRSGWAFVLCEDDGISGDYLKNKYAAISIDWIDDQQKLIIQPVRGK